MNLGIRTMKCTNELIELTSDILSSPCKIQFGLFLQIIQNEQPSADRVISVVGQISSHLSHSMHFSLLVLTGCLPSRSLMHDSILSISIASTGQTRLQAKHSITYKYILRVK